MSEFVSQLVIESAEAGTPAARVSSLAIEVAEAGTPSARISEFIIEVATTSPISGTPNNIDRASDVVALLVSTENVSRATQVGALAAVSHLESRVTQVGAYIIWGGCSPSTEICPDGADLPVGEGSTRGCAPDLSTS